MFKLLAIDIDDTLVSKARDVSSVNKRAIKNACDAGCYVTLATGRGFLGSSPIWKQLCLSGLIINYGGAMINDISTGKPFMVTELDGDVVIEILNVAESMGLHAHLYQEDEIVYERKHLYPTVYAEKLKLPSRIEPSIRSMQWKNVPKVLIITEPHRVKTLLPFFEKRFEGRAAVSASSPGFIEFNKPGASKGSALAILAQHIGVDQSDTIAIGDNTLDADMILWAGLGACVEDGNEDVKAIADVITPTCADNGVAWLINKFIL